MIFRKFHIILPRIVDKENAVYQHPKEDRGYNYVII